jgi:iron complex outermembrane receptor protein
LKVNALFQDNQTDGSNLIYVLPGLGDLQQTALIGTGEFDRKFQAYGATLMAKLGPAEFTSVTGYSINTFVASNDRSASRGAVANLNFGVTGAFLADDNRTERFTQEIRVLVPAGGRLQWLLGAFYTDEDTRWHQNTYAANPATGAVAGPLLLNDFPTTYQEYAGFADLTVDVTDRFDVQFGGRTIRNKQTYSQTLVGVPQLVAGGQSAVPELSTKQDAFTYLVTPRFRVSPDLMVYARLASGYRPGGLNPGAANFGFPNDFDSDKTNNYEIGVKGNLLERVLSFDASLFYVDWKDIQLSVLDPVTRFSFTTNASRAKSQGVELSIEARPADGLTISGWTAWNEAELSQDLPPGSAAIGVFGVSGDRLPYTSRFSANVSVDRRFSLTERLTGSVGAAATYVGDRKGAFTATSVRQDLPSYTQVDLHAALMLESWTANLFVNNVGDKRGALSGGLGTVYPFGFAYIQPRTVGLSVTKTF